MTENQPSAKQQDASELVASLPEERRPMHIAVIMDGNGRWARAQGKQRIEGHIRGVESVRNVMDACREFGIEVLTLYCLSSENWKRPAEELEFLMTLLKEYLIGERENLIKNNLKLRIIGRRERLPADVQAEMDATLDACQDNTGMTLCLAINYGARQEITDAIRSIAEKAKSDPSFDVEQIDEPAIDAALNTAGLPDPDLLIRTSGEMRISNFLLWQISYSEIYVTETLWPEFGRENLAAAICDYAGRDRRFGGIDNRGVDSQSVLGS